MRATRTAATLGLAVYEELRADVVQGRFAPGAPLRLAALTERYGTSTSVVREALVRLAAHHLAVLTPNSGYRIVPVSREDLEDLTELRVQLEGRAVERSVDRGDTAWEAALLAAHHVLDRTPVRVEGEPGSTEEWADAHAAFHEALTAACGSPRLVAITRSLRDSAEIYRQLSDTGAASGERDVAAEHRGLLDLALARCGADAARALEQHLRTTTDLILLQLPQAGPGVDELDVVRTAQ